LLYHGGASESFGANSEDTTYVDKFFQTI